MKRVTGNEEPFSMRFTTLQYTVESHVAVLTLNRPDKRNAISYELIDELLRALDEIAASRAQVLIVTGAGKAFCSGMDLDNLRAITGRTKEQNLEDSHTMARLFRSIYEFPRPTISAVNGPAVAGGCGIATLCDYTLASTEARFGYTEVRIGFLPAIVSTFLTRQVGEKQARDLLLTGRIIHPEEALRMGLINELVSSDTLMPRAYQLAATLMENSPASLLATKHLLGKFACDQLDREIAMAVEANAHIRTTADFIEGVTSFLEK
ncbi:MAG: enoyl-CoA hydratase-related protein, partial [Terriglobales bacterium]